MREKSRINIQDGTIANTLAAVQHSFFAYHASFDPSRWDSQDGSPSLSRSSWSQTCSTETSRASPPATARRHLPLPVRASHRVAFKQAKNRQTSRANEKQTSLAKVSTASMTGCTQEHGSRKIQTILVIARKCPRHFRARNANRHNHLGNAERHSVGVGAGIAAHIVESELKDACRVHGAGTSECG